MKGAIFDVDGTLLDSMGIWFDACKMFFDSHGIAISDEQKNSSSTLQQTTQSHK